MKLSIITINLNNASGLERTCQSVICQTFNDFEYIVIDGNSTDESVEIIKKHCNGINYWISEEDTGIYNAMNKGIRKAQGYYCLFLNSGDYLFSPTTLQDVFNEINNVKPADIFYSNMLKTDGSYFTYPDSLTINYLINNTISHQNSLIKRSLFLEHSFYNEELRIASDWEFFLKELYAYKSVFLHLNTKISIFDINGIGSQYSSKHYAEIINMFHNVFHELSEPIIENYNYRLSIYYEIIKNYGNTKLLTFFFTLIKILFKVLNKIKKIFKIRN